MACGNCGEERNHLNPLECNIQFRGCHNPCGVGPGNTAQCESLPSQIENFTLQFFGTIVKTEVNSQVVWSLPCDLGVGLPNNPRGVDEGLACYFLRLFHEGIVGLTGPQGPAGANGTNGNSAYSVTLRGFVQPTLSSPIVQVVTQYNPAILAGTYVFISGSGWYLVNETDGNGVLLLTLVKILDGASANIIAGKLVVPSGFPGASITGATGPQGPQGTQGPAGSTFTTTNGFYFATIGTDFLLPVTYSQVSFVNSSPSVLLPATGVYLVTAVVDVKGEAGVLTTDAVTFKLYNLSLAADVPGSEHEVSGFAAAGERRQVTLNALVQTDAPNQNIALFGKCTTANKASAIALATTISYVRVQ